ncbi:MULTISPECIES: flagellar basal body rod protein FlgB [Bacillales]|uniref:Flagellar basal body rod protein FlgB n=1 Tax=Lysinibacillus louembei TaxID=1470088 RepID=A0ABZ0RYR5_9BACI|nr:MULTISPECIES: flagellar basal body rod protein FlgB [Bacillales]MCT6923540.1 flagellar basal body rod protein FlgB [Metasolibacillus sp.]MCT6939737.1 flagellar basal body rod protein FlgB [Metasolibacillus sp.]WPK11958.1 flagellar basal body rod protein FlgB [Lysinibacillus louembei]
MDLFGGTIRNIENGLSYATLKHKTIANNIANVDTPNYKAKDVSFRSMLEGAKQTSIAANKNDVRHYDFDAEQFKSGVFDYANLRARHNGNGVNMDAEQAKLAENTIYYNALIDRVNGKLNTLNTVIKGGK